MSETVFHTGMTAEQRAEALDTLKAIVGPRVTREEPTYHRHANRSYFKDLVAAQDGGAGALRRLERHAAETREELERRDKAALNAKPEEVEFRTNPSTVQGQGGYFTPPLWLIDAFATAPRARRVFAALLPHFDLPQGVHSVNIPRLTTGTKTGATADLAPPIGQDAVDTSVTSNVVTIAGQGDVALQLLEQSGGAGLDYAFFKDLNEDYDAQLEAQLIAGNTSTGQLAGLLSLIPSANQIAYTDSTPTATEMFLLLGKVVAAIGNNRKVPPEFWLTTTSRLAWLGSSEDQQQRPLMLTDRDGSGAVDLLSFPVAMTDAIPTNLLYSTSTHTWASGGTQDVILAVRPSDGMLFESSPRMIVDREVLSGTLGVRIQLHRYAAALQRYPSGMASLGDTGLVVQSGF
jgi:HK97 family phage major capsid protein